jgi:methylenetetrahydrofolate--tRNA-(uracil-5-)-methyltransferase
LVSGGGLVGSEAAWQPAQHGAKVTLFEMRPLAMPPAHWTGDLAVLVFSNSKGTGRRARYTATPDVCWDTFV